MGLVFGHSSSVRSIRRGLARWLTVAGLAAAAVAVTSSSSIAQARLQPASVDTSSLARGTQQLTNFVGTGANSFAESMTVLGSKTLFITDDGVHGTEMWVTDGTTNGTKLLKDIAPGPNGSRPSHWGRIAVMGNKAYFAATSGELDFALWSTDGTTAGTQLVHQFTANYDDCPPSNFAVLNSYVYFSADDVDSGCELWKSDGTDVGTQPVKDVVPGGGGSYPNELTVIGSKIVYKADDANGENEPWVTDGTPSGTQRLANINTNPDESSYPNTFVPFSSNGAKVAFIAESSTGTEVWITNGTSVGTFRDSPSGFFADYLISSGSAIHYSGKQDCSVNALDVCNFLYSSNGTGLAILNVESTFNEKIQEVIASNGIVYFRQYLNGVSRLYRLTDGTRSAVLSQRPNLFVYPSAFIAASGKIFFNAIGESGYELWVSDGTDAGTSRVKEFESGQVSPDLYAASTFGSRTLLLVRTEQYGIELWISDGTPNGTTLLKDINTGTIGSVATDIAILGNKAFYTADGDSSGAELWSTDVVTGVTSLVSDINQSGDSYPSNLTVLGNKIVFRAYNDDYGDELFVTDGTRAGTRLLKDIYLNGDSYAEDFVTMGGKAYFIADDGSGRALWSTDGTENGTQFVGPRMDLIGDVVATTDKVFFLADDGSSGFELWVTNGTSAPTLIDIALGADSVNPAELTAANGYVVFRANNGTLGEEIWKSDGTPGGTTMIRDINIVSDGNGATNSSNPFGMTAMGSQVLFSASDGSGSEPWITDGTSGGTRKIKDINPYGTSMYKRGQLSPGSNEMGVFTVTASSARAFFFANDDEHGEELWATDGTESGTYLVKDVLPGPNSNSTYEVTSVGEKVFFGTSDFSNSTQYSSQFGNELWTSDGTEAGTYMVRNIAPDGAGSYPNRFKAIGNRLLFSADAYNGRGYQLFITDGSRSTFSNLAQPVRILDTRSGSKVGALDGSGAAYTLQVTGTAGVPYHGVAAVSLNVTAVSTEAGNEGGYVTVYPCGTKPEASNLNFTAGQIIPNAVVAPVSASGTVCFYVYGKAHLLADVSGWLPTGGFTALAQPERLLNTRSAGDAGKVGALNGSGAAYTLQVTGVRGIPATGVGAVAMNVTAVSTEAGNEGGYVTVYPCGTKPEASNLNFTAGQIIPNAVVAPVSASGTVCFYVYGKAHLLADVSGWMPTGGFTALAKPERLSNTRTLGIAGKVGALDGSGSVYTLQVAGQGGLPSTGIGSVALNVTVVDGLTNDFGGYVTVYPCGTKPEASNLNFTSGQIVPNAVIAPVSADGKVCIYVYGQAHILVDVSGYLAS